MRVKIDLESMRYIPLFESVTRAKVKDCFTLEDRLVFVVQPGQIGKAVGKNAENVKKLERVMKRKVKIIEFSEDLIQFIKNVVHPLKVSDIQQQDNILIIKSPDSQTRGHLIGRAASNLRNSEKIVKRFFKIDEIKVI